MKVLKFGALWCPGCLVPTFVFIDKDDKEFLRLSGEPSKEELLKVIEENKDQ